MSPAAQILVAAAALTAGCSSLKVASVCGEEMMPYEAIQGSLGICSVYCLPVGECELGAQTGKLKMWGITGDEGDCISKGFTERAAMGNISAKVTERLKWVQGPCKGMTLAKKYLKPRSAAAPPKAPPSLRVCGYEQIAYEAINAARPGTCSVFCVPEGQCNAQAMSGGLTYLGVTGQGNCKHKGYTEVAQTDSRTNATQTYLLSLPGPCAGMTLTKFQMPPPAAAPPGRRGQECKPQQTAYEGISKANPDMCSVYCVPAGDCEGQVQTGSLNHLGVLGEGNCRGRGFTERMQHTAVWAKYVQGACKGMEVTNFQRPGVMAQKSVPSIPFPGLWAN